MDAPGRFFGPSTFNQRAKLAWFPHFAKEKKKKKKKTTTCQVDIHSRQTWLLGDKEEYTTTISQ
jgi:hypothetical protein